VQYNFWRVFSVAVDTSGNVYIADQVFGNIYKWNGSTLTTLVNSGLSSPQGVAVDSSGNVYIADTSNNAIKKYSGGTVTTLVNSGLSYPCGVAVDSSGNVYIADTNNNAIKKVGVYANTVYTFTGNGSIIF